MLKTDDKLLVDVVNELDSWNGYADGFRCYPMDELDELFYDCKVSEFLEKLTGSFNLHDEYMVDTIYGLDSTDDPASVYRNNISEESLLDDIIDNRNNIYFYNTDFEDLIDEIIDYEEEEEQPGVLDRVAASVNEVGKSIDSISKGQDSETATA